VRRGEDLYLALAGIFMDYIKELRRRLKNIMAS